jgi:hypothetical protein
MCPYLVVRLFGTGRVRLRLRLFDTLRVWSCRRYHTIWKWSFCVVVSKCIELVRASFDDLRRDSVGFDRFRALMRVRGWWDLPRSAPLNLQNFLSFMTAIAHWSCLLKTS